STKAAVVGLGCGSAASPADWPVPAGAAAWAQGAAMGGTPPPGPTAPSGRSASSAILSEAVSACAFAAALPEGLRRGPGRGSLRPAPRPRNAGLRVPALAAGLAGSEAAAALDLAGAAGSGTGSGGVFAA